MLNIISTKCRNECKKTLNPSSGDLKMKASMWCRGRPRPRPGLQGGRVSSAVFATLVGILLWRGDVADGLSSSGSGSPSSLPAQFRSRSQVYRSKVGDSIELECKVENLGSTVITWYKGDRIVSAGSLKILNEPRFNVLTSPDGSVTLAIRKVRMGDEDDYVCEVNLKDAPISITHHLEVLVPPRIHSVSGNGRITARKGSAISLNCSASGHPAPAIHWERQHHKYFSSGRLTAGGPALDLADIGREDEGVYICVADNQVSRPVTQSIALNVLYPPEVRVDTPFVHAAPGDSAQLECIVQGNPEPTVNWYKGSMKLSDGERHSAVRVAGKRYRLAISPVLRADFGNYSCVSENGLGKVRGASTRVTLTGAPTRPQVTSSSTGRHRYSYDLKWRSASPYPVLQHRIEYWPKQLTGASSNDTSRRNSRERYLKMGELDVTGESGGDDDFDADAEEAATESSRASVLFEYNIKGLQPQTKYTIRVQTRNEAGWSPESEPFAFSTSHIENVPKELQSRAGDEDMTVMADTPKLQVSASASSPATTTALTMLTHLSSTLILVAVLR